MKLKIIHNMRQTVMRHPDPEQSEGEGSRLRDSSAFGLRMTLLGAVLVQLSSSPAHALFDDQEKVSLKNKLQALEQEKTKLAGEVENLNRDNQNILSQAKALLSEKESLLAKVQAVKGLSSQSDQAAESLVKEVEILKGEIEKLKAARQKDSELHLEEKKAVEKKAAEQEARANSLVGMMENYPPEKIQSLVEDRNRLQEENNSMAKRVTEHEKRMGEMRRAMSPLELDREELHRVQTENKELLKRASYVGKLEERQQQLIRENAEYRERLEAMKGKFKEAVPGLAKSSRISQKMMRENADMHYNLGTIFLHNKQYREAIKEYERVLELRPSDPETHYNLGVLYDDYLKDRQKSLYHYQKYLAVNPKSPDAKKVESYILSLELEQKVR